MDKQEFLMRADLLEKLIDSKEWDKGFLPWLETQVKKNENISSIKAETEEGIVNSYRLQAAKVNVYRNIPNAIKNIISEAKLIREAEDKE